MSSKIRLSNKVVSGFKAPTFDRDEYFDTHTKGLSIRVATTGHKSWYYTRWIASQKRRKRYKIGDFPEIGTTDARQRAELLLKNKVLSSEEEQIAAMTFEDAYARYVEEHLEGYARTKTILNYDQLMKNYLDSLRGYRLESLPKQKVKDVYMEVAKYAPVAALRAMEVVRAVCKYWQKRCPEVQDATDWIDRAREKKKLEEEGKKGQKRTLNLEESKLFLATGLEIWKATKDLSVLAVVVALLTGARRSNVFQMEWGELNLSSKKWEIPAKKYKGRKDMVIFLTEPLATILEELKKKNGTSKRFVFHSSGAKDGHLTDNRKAFKRIAEAAGMDTKGLNMHAMRRTFVTQAAMCDLPTAVLMRLAGHKTVGCITFDVYTDIDDMDIREGFEKVSQRMLGL